MREGEGGGGKREGEGEGGRRRQRKGEEGGRGRRAGGGREGAGGGQGGGFPRKNRRMSDWKRNPEGRMGTPTAGPSRAPCGPQRWEDGGAGAVGNNGGRGAINHKRPCLDGVIFVPHLALKRTKSTSQLSSSACSSGSSTGPGAQELERDLKRLGSAGPKQTTRECSPPASRGPQRDRPPTPPSIFLPRPADAGPARRLARRPESRFFTTGSQPHALDIWGQMMVRRGPSCASRLLSVIPGSTH